MHLRDVRANLNGGLAAVGRVQYPMPATSGFELPQHDCLEINFQHDLLHLVPCTAARDEESGFLVTRRIGPSLFAPIAITACCLAVLRAQSPTSIKMQSPGQGGFLSTFEGEYRTQKLSNWTLDIEVAESGLRFHLSADLRMLETSELKGEDNYWSAVPEPAARIEVRFEVDSVTRTAVFGVLLPRLEKNSDPFNWHSSGSAQRTVTNWLEAASIDQLGRMHAHSANGMFSLIQAGDTLCVEPSSGSRLGNGFLAGSGSSYPRISLTAISLAALMPPHEVGAKSIVLREGLWGDVQNEMRGEIPSQNIDDAEISALFEKEGLIVRCRLKLEVPEAGLPDAMILSLRIPWASLILRFPGKAFAHVAKRLQKTK
jgi:hypothetical protein